jgi:hypothetical protein
MMKVTLVNTIFDKPLLEKTKHRKKNQNQNKKDLEKNLKQLQLC